MTPKKIAVFIGSLRKESYCRKVAKELISLSSKNLNFEIIDIGGLPMYNQDFDEDPPATWREFREQVKSFNGVLFITPEYNRSVPAVLKNAIDVGSRPYGKSIWDGKPTAVVSVSIGSTGGFGANHHLRQSLVFLNMPAMQQPEAYIGNATKLFDDKGNLTNESTRDFFKKFIDAYTEWVDKNIPS